MILKTLKAQKLNFIPNFIKARKIKRNLIKIISRSFIQNVLLPWLELKLKLIILSCRITLTLIMQLLNAHKKMTASTYYLVKCLLSTLGRRETVVYVMCFNRMLFIS